MKKKKKKGENQIFDSIRKPTAPPGKTIGQNKPEEKAHPALRKNKHKKPESTEE